MNLQEKLNNDIKLSMKNKDSERLSILRVVKGEMDRIGKDIPNESVIKIIRKMKENSIMNNNNTEVDILSEYLPSMLEERQLEIIISGIIHLNNYTNISDMKHIMMELKEKYGSTVDGKIASDIIKNIFKK